MTDGFNQQQSDTAIRSIHEAFSALPNAPSTVELTNQKFCSGIDDRTVEDYCEKVHPQDRYEVSKGSCRAKSCAMNVPLIVSQARDQGLGCGSQQQRLAVSSVSQCPE